MSDTPTSTRNENNIASPPKEINQITMNCVIHCTKKQKNDKPTCYLSSNKSTIMASLSLARLKVEEEEDDYESEYVLRCINISYIKTTYSTLTQYFIASTKHYTCGENINIKRS
jgi:hypothetical protein